MCESLLVPCVLPVCNSPDFFSRCWVPPDPVRGTLWVRVQFSSVAGSGLIYYIYYGMKNLAFYFLLLLCLFSAAVRDAKAQGTQDALTPSFTVVSGPPGSTPPYSPNPLGFVNGGVGWSFTPTENLAVTAIASTASQVSFWQGTSQILASFDYSVSNYTFEPIVPILLSAGQSYSISTQYPNYTWPVIINLGSFVGNDGPPVSMSSYLTGFRNYLISTNGEWTLSPAPPNNADDVFLGPNFQFQVVPEPTCFALLILGLSFFIRKPKFVN